MLGTLRLYISPGSYRNVLLVNRVSVSLEWKLSQKGFDPMGGGRVAGWPGGTSQVQNMGSYAHGPPAGGGLLTRKESGQPGSLRTSRGP